MKARSVTRVTTVVLLFYLLFTAVALIRHDFDPFWFVWLGERFDQLQPDGRLGYDGQFAYYIARDGLDAAVRLDIPTYRLQRILLPLLARIVGLGQPYLIPWGLLFINLIAIVSATYLLGRWLYSKGQSPWYALLYGLSVGVFMAYSRSLNEPLAYALAIAGLAAWDNRKQPLAILCFALAALAKEQALLFPFSLAIGGLASRQFRQVILLSLASVPLLVWEIYLWVIFGTWGVGQGSSVGLIPLHGILSQLTLEAGRISGLLFVALPALGLLGLAIYWLWCGNRQPVVWLLLFHAAFVLLLPPDVFDHLMHAGRNATGLTAATVFAVPAMRREWRWALGTGWIMPTFIWLVPVLRWAPWLTQI
jgi:hypothetical protein